MFARRDLPPTSLLIAFESVARLLSFTAAASELHLTQSAVSRQIRALEEFLGIALFIRERQTVRLSGVGQTYAQEVREALTRITSATLACKANPQGGVLNLAILPTFGTRWLAPRLPDFFQRHPGTTLNISTRLAAFDFQLDPQDAAIHFGESHWPGSESTFLMNETVVPACSPEFLAQNPIDGVPGLSRQSLIHLASRSGAWPAWFRTQGMEPPEAPGMHFDQFATAAQAAVAGIGVALLPSFLIARELQQGELVSAVPGLPPVQSIGAYYLVWPTRRANYPPLAAFRSWLQDKAAAFTRGEAVTGAAPP
ncbi:LysR family transcriptional regulator [Corticibacter populi]|uniref:LysR family transcriptional regulator n=1 Tax=Corticibacter populi TaxID=1550736 RepID=A0A3M6QY55_9BURK|nr:LysR family transcriptional regulator [Corticibacter populi]RMX07950.1 LysR family transcriptional regulator [Corticibacter populi]RZS35191.1 DNA-binding transcriptional LysR family regulator [Corticibacter populi]